MKTVQKIKEITKEEIISGKDSLLGFGTKYSEVQHTAVFSERFIRPVPFGLKIVFLFCCATLKELDMLAKIRQ
jgi:hypothetical protein